MRLEATTRHHDPGRAEFGEIRRRASDDVEIVVIAPEVRARDRQAEVAQDLPGVCDVATGHTDRLDAAEPGLGDGRQGGDVKAESGPTEAGRVAERVELDRERERERWVPGQLRLWSMPPTCSSSFQATSASPRTNARKSHNVITRQRMSVVAVTVAVRTRSLMSATSPK